MYKSHKIEKRSNRRGAVIPMFAILLPVLLIFCGFAINLAYMQVASTEMKIATDCAAHAGGRAMSVSQEDGTGLTLQERRDLAIAFGIEKAQELAGINTVLGRQLSVGGQGSGSDIEIGFGRSVRGNDGFGMYEYTEIPEGEVANGNSRPSSLHVSANMNVQLPFRMLSTTNTGGLSSFSPSRRSVATQVNRDVALILDRSASMLHFFDRDLLEDTIDDLYNEEREFFVYIFWTGSDWELQEVDSFTPAPTSWLGPFRYSSGPTIRTLISKEERDDALDRVAGRNFSDNVIYQLERWTNENHTLGLHYSERFQNDPSQPDYDPDDDQFAHGDRDDLTQPMAIFARDYEKEYRQGIPGSPRFSRGDLQAQGVEAFLNVLEVTDQEELVSLVTFNSSARIDWELQRPTDDEGVQPFVDGSYANIRREMLTLTPGGGTAIGDGLLTAIPAIIPGPNDTTSIARPFAAKTIVVLTDGSNTFGVSPADAVSQIADKANVTIHTITLSSGAQSLAAIAEAGQGQSYHDNDGTNLNAIFEEIANTLPTILTE